MPARRIIFAVGESYHIFNRSLHNLPIFGQKRQANNFLRAMAFYLAANPPVKFSIYRQSSKNYSVDFSDPLVKIIAYCLMPSHFHFILQQNQSNGIRIYMQRLINSYSHYFNVRNQRKGPLFEGVFKALRVETEEQLIHLSRYIHLNPVSSYLVENPEEYGYSSFKAYLGQNDFLPIETSFILSQFSSTREYEKFVLARKNYQRKLEEIKHLLLENPGS